ncbi:hypothetical protein [Nostoc sp.]|uniref:hypothetical protein n=1 Tax=Nostoc sp. TaxID=1180 RepID=UPI002FF74DEA
MHQATRSRSYTGKTHTSTLLYETLRERQSSGQRKLSDRLRGLKTFDFFLVHGGGLCLYSQASAGTEGFHATSFNGGNPRNGVAPHEQLACDF